MMNPVVQKMPFGTVAICGATGNQGGSALKALYVSWGRGAMQRDSCEHPGSLAKWLQYRSDPLHLCLLHVQNNSNVDCLNILHLQHRLRATCTSLRSLAMSTRPRRSCPSSRYLHVDLVQYCDLGSQGRRKVVR